MKKLIVLFLIVSGSSLHAQEQTADSLFQAGILYKNLGQHQEAIELFSRAIEYNPWELNYWYYRGFVQIDAEQYHEAIADFSYILLFNPTYTRALTERAFALKRIGMDTMALEDYKTAATVAPEDYSANYKLGYMLIDFGDYKSAITHLKKAVASSPNTDSYYELGYAYMENKQFKDATLAFQKVLSLNTDPNLSTLDDVQLHLGKCYLELGEKLKACGYLKKAYEMGKFSAQEYMQGNCD